MQPNSKCQSPHPQEVHIPKVSIGMPVFNGVKYIREALDSLLAQTFTDFELIISDNASTDGTEAICREYAAKDMRIRYVRQVKNQGPVANFQFVLNEAKGQYFMWAAHDDRWENAFLKEAISLIESADIDFVFPSFKLASISFKFKRSMPISLFKFIENKCGDLRFKHFLNLHHLSHKCNIVYSLFSKDFLLECWKLQNISNDGVFGLMIVLKGEGKVLPQPLFEKRYKYFWPGLINIPHFNLKNNQKSFNLAKINAAKIMVLMFPQYRGDIEMVFNAYDSNSHCKNFKIIENYC